MRRPPPSTPIHDAALKATRSSFWMTPPPPDAGKVVALLGLFLEGTAGVSRRIRGGACADLIRACVEGRIEFGPNDMGFIRAALGRLGQYVPNDDQLLPIAIKARNYSAATAIERVKGYEPWWFNDPALDPAPVVNGRRPSRRRLYEGAELIVLVDGLRSRARVTRLDNDSIRLKVGPNASLMPTSGFRFEIWSRAELAAHCSVQAPAHDASDEEEDIND